MERIVCELAEQDFGLVFCFRILGKMCVLFIRKDLVMMVYGE